MWIILKLFAEKLRQSASRLKIPIWLFDIFMDARCANVNERLHADMCAINPNGDNRMEWIRKSWNFHENAMLTSIYGEYVHQMWFLMDIYFFSWTGKGHFCNKGRYNPLLLLFHPIWILCSDIIFMIDISSHGNHFWFTWAARVLLDWQVYQEWKHTKHW